MTCFRYDGGGVMKAFCWCKKYKDPSHTHLDHVFRVRTKKRGLGGPDGITVWGDRAHLYHVVLKGKTVNRYIDVTVSGVAAEIVPELIAALETRYDRQGRVVAVLHTDEAVPHVHLLVPWTDTSGKALRLKKGEWMAVDKKMAAITGHELTPRGQGRSRIETKRWEADPDTARRLAAEMTEKDRATLDQVERVIKLYGGITVFVSATEILQANVTAIADLNLRQLRLLNRSKSIFFGPGEGFSRVVCLDGVPKGQLLYMPCGSLVIRTSQGRYQVHLLLDRKLNEKQRSAVRGWLAAKHEAGSGGYHRAALLPGFCEPGHLDGEPVQIVRGSGVMPDLAYQDYLYELRVEKETKTLHQEALQRKKSSGNYDSIGQSVKMGWDDFYAGDASAADHGYVLYLLRHGLTDSDVVHRVVVESRNIVTRKSEAVIPYVRQIIESAKTYIFSRDARVSEKKAVDNSAGAGATVDQGEK
jgi:hypothetical protein